MFTRRRNLLIHIQSDMDQMRESPPSPVRRLQGFNILMGLTEFIGLLLVICVIVWTTYFRGGFAWGSDPGHQFNWHPLLMTIGLVYLYGNGILIYRWQRTVRKKKLKLMHGGIMIFSFLLTVIGLVSVFDSHNLQGTPNMYTLHSWVGLTTVILFACQWVAGFVSFMYPGVAASLRGAYLPIHVYFGTAGFVGAIASCLLGLNEKAIWTLKNYSDFPSEGVFINIIGLIFVIFGGLTVYLVSQENYKRQPLAEDNQLLNRQAAR